MVFVCDNSISVNKDNAVSCLEYMYKASLSLSFVDFTVFWLVLDPYECPSHQSILSGSLVIWYVNEIKTLDLFIIHIFLDMISTKVT